jgi:sulfur-oxidizing protein SoxZ
MADTPATPAAAPAAAPPAPARPAVRALVTLPPAIRRGEVFDVRTLVAHPMETGHRADSLGTRVPRDIVRRVEARLDGELVFAADLQQAIAANPYVVFPLIASGDGTLTVSWAGDRGFAHSVSVALKVQ